MIITQAQPLLHGQSLVDARVIESLVDARVIAIFS
jgi:hypothetical protein